MALFLAWLQIEDHAMDISNGAPAYDNGVFFERIGTNGERYVLLDLEHAFGTPEWTAASLRPAASDFVLPKHLKVYLEALSEAKRSELFATLATIDESDIRRCFEGYPSGWCGTVDKERARDWAFERARLLGRWSMLDGHTVRIVDDTSRQYP